MAGQLTTDTTRVTTSDRQGTDVVDVDSLLLGLELADAINRLGQAIAEQLTADSRSAALEVSKHER